MPDTAALRLGLRAALALIVAAAIAACGFRLAGTARLPPELGNIYLVDRGFNSVQRSFLESRLIRAGAQIAPTADGDAVRLQVTLVTLPNRRLATGAGSGKVVERVSRRLDIVVTAADGEVWVPPESLLQESEFELDENNLLASNQERARAIEDLERALWERLIRRLQRI